MPGEETVCPVTQEVCRTHWCHNSFDCAQYHAYQCHGLATEENTTIDVFDSLAMQAVEGISV